MNIIRFDPRKHPRNRRGEFRKVLKALESGQELRLPGGVRITKHDGKIRIATPAARAVEPESLDAAVTLGLRARELQDEVDALSDEIGELKPDDRRTFDVPGGDLEVVRSPARDPDGWDFSISGHPASNLTPNEVAQIIARRRQQPAPPKSPGVNDVPMGTLTAVEPFSFTAAGAVHELAKGQQLDVLRKSGSSWLVRAPDHKGVGVIARGDGHVVHQTIWPPLPPKSPGTTIVVDGEVTQVSGPWKEATSWDTAPPGTPVRWVDDDLKARYGIVVEFDGDPPGQYVIKGEDGREYIIAPNTADELEVSGEWPAIDGWVAKARALHRR